MVGKVTLRRSDLSKELKEVSVTPSLIWEERIPGRGTSDSKDSIMCSTESNVASVTRVVLAEENFCRPW